MKRLLIICFILQLALTETQVILSIKSVMKFPHFIENRFLMQIQPLAANSKLSNDATDTMVIRIADSNFTEVERESLIYGVQDIMDDEFNGKFMDIKVWEKDASSTKMNISIMFKQNAHQKYLEIFYFSSQNKFQRKKYLKNIFLAKRLFHELIELLIPPKLSISMSPINVDRNEIIINDFVMASCRVFGGIPHEKPKFGNISHLNVTETKYNEKDNEIKMYFHVSLREHFSHFTCFAGNVTEMYTIRINHHPSKIYIKPDINELLQANSTIICYTQDGYPKPEIHFQLIKGSSNASLYYETRGNGSQIYLNFYIPVESEWKFKCSIKSTIVNDTNIITKDIVFKTAAYPTSIVINPMPKEILESNSTIQCAPTDGYPTPTIHWQIVMGPANSSIYYDIRENGTQIHFSKNCPTKSEWKIKCVLESCIENICKILNKTVSFRIANHPTKLYIHPNIKKRIRSNSTIKCLTTDGFPDPEINWHFIEGPQNAGLFYNISEKTHQIHIKSNSPIGSKWTFKCTMNSNLTKTYKFLNKNISFVIAKNPIEICDEKCLNSRISEIEESVEENSKLHDEIKNFLSEIKQQLKSQVKEQQEMSNKLNEINLNVKLMNQSIYNYEYNFEYNFDKISFIEQESPNFLSVYPLSVRIWNDFLDNRHMKFRFKLKFTNKNSTTANINIQYKCWIAAIRSPNIKKFVIFDIKYSGGGNYDTNVIVFPSREVFGSDLLIDTRCLFKCLISFSNN